MICKECGSLFDPPEQLPEGVFGTLEDLCADCAVETVLQDFNMVISNRLWEENPEALKQIEKEEEEDNP